MKASQIKELKEVLKTTSTAQKKVKEIIEFLVNHSSEYSAEQILNILGGIILPSVHRQRIVDERAGNYYHNNAAKDEITTWNSFEVNLWDLVRYIPNAVNGPTDPNDYWGDPNDEWGFRIYPAYDGTSIYLLVGISKYNDPNVANAEYPGYFQLKGNYSEGYFNYGAADRRDDVVGGFKNYWNNVLLTPAKSLQKDIHAIKSRFFYFSEVISFISTNVEMTPNELKKCKVQFEIGYVTDGMNDILSNDYLEPAKPYHVGFAVVLSIITPGGKSSMSLEVARPCPPRCGDLSYL